LDAAKAVLRGKYIAIETYLKKARKNSNNLNLCLKELEKEQTKSKVSRGKEVIQSRIEINDVENKEQ